MEGRERILTKIGELEGYLEELKKITPKKFSVYEKSIEEIMIFLKKE